MPLAVGEDGDRTRGVVADAREREERVDVVGHDAAVPLGDLHGRRVQPERATRVAERRPGAHGLAGRDGGEIGGGRPAVEPLLEARDDAGDRASAAA